MPLKARPGKFSGETDARHFSARFRVPFHEPGPDGKIGIVALANYLQQAAGEHAEQLGVGAALLAEKDLYWVLTRQFIRIARLPAGGEEIAVETWPSRRPRQLFFRDFRVMGDGSEVLAAATSVWALIEGSSRKAVRGPAWLVDSIIHDEVRAAAFPGRAVPRREVRDIDQAILPRRSDLDANGHVNNAVLMGYLLEPLARRADDVQTLGTIEVVFRAECGLEHDVRSQVGEIAPGRFHHTLLRSDGVEVARAETSWA